MYSCYNIIKKYRNWDKVKCRGAQWRWNKPQHQQKWLNLHLPKLQISPFASSVFHPLQSEKKPEGKTFKKLKNAVAGAWNSSNQQVQETQAFVPFVKQKTRSPRSVALSSSADPRSPSWRKEGTSVEGSHWLLGGSQSQTYFSSTYRWFTVCNCTCEEKYHINKS